MTGPGEWSPEDDKDPLRDVSKQLGRFLERAGEQIPAGPVNRITVSVGEASYMAAGASWSQPLEGMTEDERWQLLAEIRRQVLERLRELHAHKRAVVPPAPGSAPAAGA